MKRILIAALILFSTSLPALAESDDIECASDNCAGWTAEYETLAGSSGDGVRYSGVAEYRFYNTTEKPAFNIKIVIDFFDYMGEPIDRYQFKEEGPIHKYIIKRGYWPKRASRLTFNIYATDDLHGDKFGRESAAKN